MKRELTYATVCSGVECMGAAVADLPIRPIFFSEIEPFPCAVLEARYPDVPNLGDMAKIRIDNEKGVITNGSADVAIPDGGLDILAGGTPCQDVSSAGRRRGMAEGSGTRSSLAFEFVRLVRELKPRFVLWENVAGVLSDQSFPGFLTALAECGYGLAYRVLDAQWIRCADIHHKDGRVVGLERAIPQRRRRVWVVGCAGGDAVASSEILFERNGIAGNHPPRRVTRKGIARATESCDGVDACVVGATGIAPNIIGRGERSGGNGIGAKDEVAYTLDTTGGSGCAVVYDDHSQGSRVTPCKDNVSPTIAAKAGNGGGNLPICVHSSVQAYSNGMFSQFNASEVSGTLDSSGHMESVGNGTPCILTDENICDMRFVVRRLTPTECERLMGLIDGWTIPNIPNELITNELVERFMRIHDSFGSIMAAYE